ncbi:MAG: hypothetical protein ABR956_07810 [Terracidiphilus sp.]
MQTERATRITFSLHSVLPVATPLNIRALIISSITGANLAA